MSITGNIFEAARNKLLDKATKPEAAIANHVIDTFAAADCELSRDICREITEGTLDIKKCYADITAKARKQATGSVAMITDTEVYKWALEYFGWHGAPTPAPKPVKPALDIDFDDLFGEV